LPVDAHYDAVQDPKVKLVELASLKSAEGYMQVTSADGVSLVVSDAIANLPKAGLFGGLLMHPTGVPSVPRIIRLMLLNNKPLAKQEVEAMAAVPNLKRVVFAHGKWITENPAEQLR